MNEHQRNIVISQNELLDQTEYHEYSDDCYCPNCMDERSDRCECGNELTNNDVDFCSDCS